MSERDFEPCMTDDPKIPGLYCAAWYLGGMLGPALGGVLTDNFGFRWADG